MNTATSSPKTQLLFNANGAVRLVFFAAYQDRMPNAIQIVETAFYFAEARGFSGRDELVAYATDPNDSNRSRGNELLDALLAVVDAREFFTLSGIQLVETKPAATLLA